MFHLPARQGFERRHLPSYLRTALSAVGIGHFKPVVTKDQTRQLVISKDHIGMRFSSSLIRINFKDEITTFNPYITIDSNHNYMFEYSCI